MKAPKPLKELPGFDDALAKALLYYGELFPYDFTEVGGITIPGIKRVECSMLQQLALLTGVAKHEESRRLKLVLSPRPVAANDCEAP